MKRPPSDQQLDSSLVWRNRRAIECELAVRFGLGYLVDLRGARAYFGGGYEIVPWSVLAPIINRAEGD